MTDVETAVETARAFLAAHPGWLEARDPLREDAMAMLNDGNPLVDPWRQYALETLDDRPRKKGQRRTKFLHRNYCIAEAIYLIVKSGFPAHRNKAKAARKGAGESACSIVVVALSRLGVNMSEAAVEEIWRRAPFDWNPNPENDPPPMS